MSEDLQTRRLGRKMKREENASRHAIIGRAPYTGLRKILESGRIQSKVHK